jgi:hypothetical protein
VEAATKAEPRVQDGPMIRVAVIPLVAIALAIASASAWAQNGVPTNQTDDPTSATARARFKEGVEFYDKAQYEQARTAFLQAYELKRHPAVLLNLAWSCVNSGRSTEADQYFKQFLSEAKDITPKQRAEVNDGLKWVQAVKATPVSLPTKAEADLPTYTYAIKSQAFVDAGAFTTAIHYVIPNTIWLLDITYGNQGLLARVSAPSVTAGVPELFLRVSCAKTDSDTARIHLSTFAPGALADLTIGCQRLKKVDDGFDDDDEAASTSASPSPPPGEAFLNINSLPTSTCFLDGRLLGSTPRAHVAVKPGTHTVKFMDYDGLMTKIIVVSVGAGETKVAAAKLSE